MGFEEEREIGFVESFGSADGHGRRRCRRGRPR